MTRETKVGVAVAGSFLGLVAAVVVLRMGNVDDSAPTTDASAQTTRDNSGVAAVDLRTVPGKAQEPGDVLPASYQSGNLLPVPDNKTPVAAGASDPAKDILGGMPLAPPIPTPTTIPALPVAAVPEPAPSPPAATKNVPASETANSRTNDVTKPPPIVPSPSDTIVPPLSPSVPVTAKENKLSADDDKQRTVKNELKKQLAVSTQTVPSPDKQKSADITWPPATPAKPADDLPLPPAPTPIAKEGTLGPPPFPPAPAGAPNGPPTTDTKQPAAGLPPDKPAPAPAAVAMGPKATDNPLGERSRPLNGGVEAQPPRQPAASSLTVPPVGAPPAANSAPIKVPVAPAAAASGGAKVQSYDTETHTCKPGENSFADLSKTLYGSEKYAPALLQFNRENPLVGDSFRDSSPRLKPGQQVVVPPVWVLEEPRYATPPPASRASAEPARPPAPVAPPRAPAAPPSVPAVAAPAPNPAPANNPAPKTAAAAGPRVYMVRGNGEMLYEIARQTLGDGKRWSEIYRLNPDIRPELAIPGGTQLRLPADARIGS